MVKLEEHQDLIFNLDFGDEWLEIGKLTGVKIILGVCGSVAIYKAAHLVRELCALGALVRVVMTKSALEFMQPMIFQALSGQEVLYDLFNTSAEHAMGHIELARWADYVIIAPASTNFIAKMAHGIADNLLSTLYMATDAAVIICPAMNQKMWEHPATYSNCALLQERGVLICGPDAGSQACGDNGLGRMVEIETILTTLKLYPVQNSLCGKDFLITAGPTRETIDPVRYLSNYSSGKMGYCLAQAAQIAGANVTLVSGPSSLPPPFGVKFISVNSAKEMLTAVMNHIKPEMVFIGAAAVADYCVNSPETTKIKRQDVDSLRLSLERNPDILSAVVSTNFCKMVIGFAAETQELLVQAKHKLSNKKVDMIIANQVGPNLGFETDSNQVTILTAHRQFNLPLASKISIAGQIIIVIAAALKNNIRSCYEPRNSN